MQSLKLKIIFLAIFFVGVLFLPKISLAATTVTYNVATESNAGMDGAIAWESVFLLNDGRIASFGTGNHVPDQSNAMRIIDPVSAPGVVTAYDAFPWTQSGGVNRYVSNYDNHPSIYLPSVNKAVWAGHGVFDFAVNSWTYGDRSPNTQEWTAYVSDPQGGMESTYNPSVAWCSSINTGVWFGSDGGGYGRYDDDMSLIVAAGSNPPWTINVTNMGSQGVAGMQDARNTAVCIGNILYVGGPRTSNGVNVFYKINVSTKTRLATLAPYPAGESFPQMVYDSNRGRIVLIGSKLYEYDLSANAWTNVTPSGWPGYSHVRGVYNSTNNAIYFSGIPANGSDSFKWHMIKFSGTAPPTYQCSDSVDNDSDGLTDFPNDPGCSSSTDNDEYNAPPADTETPSIPANLSAIAVSSNQINLTWTASSDNVGVTGYRVYRGGTQIATITTNSYSNTGLSPSTTYTYTVSAYDEAGNVSGQSASASATTQAQSGGGSLNIPINTWVKKDSPAYPASPGAHNKHTKMAYNSDNRAMYIIGGDYLGDGGQNSREMIYKYDVAANTWTNVLNYIDSGTSGFPEGRCNPGWTYDPVRKVFWMGMGQNREPNPRPGLLKGGLWTFDPNTAILSEKYHLEGPDVPNPYSSGSPNLPANSAGDVWYMLYDNSTDALFVGDAYGAASPVLAKYNLNGITIKNGVSKDRWSALSIADPGPYTGVTSYALDTKTNKIVFYSPWPGKYGCTWNVSQWINCDYNGTNRGETWEYIPSTNTWTKISDQILPPKSDFGMVYDSVNDKIVLFGGYDSHEGAYSPDPVPLNDIWVMDRNSASSNYNKWVKLSVSGQIPSPRKGESMAYDAYNNAIVVFGGTGWETYGQPDAYGYYGNEIFLLRLGTAVSDTTPPASPTGVQVS